MVRDEICYHEKSRLEAGMKIEIPHKSSFYKDEDGFTYCKICEDGFDSGWPREFARLYESKRHYLRTSMKYPNHEAEPLRHNQKITDEYLLHEFKGIQGEYLKIKDLKFVWDGFIDVNDSDKSTTVVSSSYLRRLGKITQFKWTQQRAEGKDGEKLVIFRQTTESWVDPKIRAKKEQLDKLKLLDLEEKWENKLSKLEYQLSVAKKGFDPEIYIEWEKDPDAGVDLDFESEKAQKEHILYLISKINKIRDALNLPTVSLDDKSTDGGN